MTAIIAVLLSLSRAARGFLLALVLDGLDLASKRGDCLLLPRKPAGLGSLWQACGLSLAFRHQSACLEFRFDIEQIKHEDD